MNFFKYQNLPNRSANKEIALISDPRVNVLQNLYNQSNDELWIESWLQHNSIYRPIPKVKIGAANNPLSISEAQTSLKDCLLTLDRLSKAQQSLRTNVETLSSAEWKQKTVEIGYLKDHLTKLISKFENGDTIFALKKLVDKRKKKRLRQKKQKEFRRNMLEEKFKNREKLHKSIDKWLQAKKEEVEKIKIEEDMKKDADCVLAEVTKKKSDARKQLSLINSLNKLRNVRDQIATYGGQNVSQQDRNAFNITVEKLNKMWESALDTYGQEEHGLKLMLEKTANDDSKSALLAKENKLLEEWLAIFFGSKEVISPDNSIYWALTAAERDTDTFIAIRRSWDTFLVSSTNEMGSKIPIGWILPDSIPSEGWSKYLTSG